MKHARLIAVGLVATLGLAGCSTSPIVTRKVAFEQTLLMADAKAETVLISPEFTVTEVHVSVPETLRVSEANTIKPRADIVWHGDPVGDRYAQVKAIVEEALREGTADLEGPRKVILEAEVERFHALTPRTRYTIGGMHEIVFLMTLRDAETGEPLGPPKVINADLEGLGGDEAIAAEARGETQKVRIEAHLRQVIHDVLSQPIEAYAG